VKCKEAHASCVGVRLFSINLKICATTGRMRNASGTKVAHILVTKGTFRPDFLPANLSAL